MSSNTGMLNRPIYRLDATLDLHQYGVHDFGPEEAIEALEMHGLK